MGSFGFQGSRILITSPSGVQLTLESCPGARIGFLYDLFQYVRQCQSARFHDDNLRTSPVQQPCVVCRRPIVVQCSLSEELANIV